MIDGKERRKKEERRKEEEECGNVVLIRYFPYCSGVQVRTHEEVSEAGT